jgi:hypothetical protein
MVAAGHWRAETEEEKKSAWEESVRLRERMFWSRLGGGVVPSFIPMRESPRSPGFASGKADVARKSEESQISDGKPLDSAVDMTESVEKARKSEDDPFSSKEGDQTKRVSIGRTVLSEPSAPTDTLTQEEEKIEQQAEAQLREEVRKLEEVNAELRVKHQRSVSTPLSPEPTSRRKDERLSLTIPGAFE